MRRAPGTREMTKWPLTWEVGGRGWDTSHELTEEVGGCECTDEATERTRARSTGNAVAAKGSFPPFQAASRLP